MNLEIQL